LNREQYVKMRAVEDRHWWYLGMRAIHRDVLRAARLPADARVLDAGCGTGGNFGMLGRIGQVVGIDFSDLALELSAERGVGQLARASVTALPFRSDSFDLVTSFDVLCHRSIGDDAVAFGEFRRVLKPGGALLVQLPALKWLEGAHDREVHTVRRYTADELRAKARAAGLEPERVTYVNGLLSPLAAARRIAQRLVGAHGDDLGETPSLLEAGFRSALALERRLLQRGDLPVGVSVLALARRPR
jgi:SAM-dependent methyltransferase